MQEQEQEQERDPGEDDDVVAIGDIFAEVDDDIARADREADRAAALRVKQARDEAALEAERIIIGALVDRGAAVIDECEGVTLSHSSFNVRIHAMLWHAAAALWKRERRVSAMSLADALRTMGLEHEAGGAAGIAKMRRSATPREVASAAVFLAERERARRLRRVVLAADNRAALGDPAVEVAAAAVAELGAIATEHRSFGNDLRAACRKAIERMPSVGGVEPGISSGFVDLDYLSRLCPGSLFIVAGRPSMGKSQFVLDIVRHVATGPQPKPVHIFSLEMSDVEISERLMAAHSRVDFRRFRLDPPALARVAAAESAIGTAPIHVDDSPGITIADIRARTIARARSVPPALVVVDYLQLVDAGSSSAGANGAQRIAEVSRGLKTLARIVGCPVIALSQLNRSVETRPDKRPLMSDLRESGAIEQDADVVAMLYRAEYYLREKTPPDEQGIAEVIVAKNRNGATGVARLRFSSSPPWFGSLATP